MYLSLVVGLELKAWFEGEDYPTQVSILRLLDQQAICTCC